MKEPEHNPPPAVKRSSVLRKAARRVWIWIVILTAILWLYPVEYQVTRVALTAGLAAVWVGALGLWWGKKIIRLTLILTAGLLTLVVCLPGRSPDPQALANDYARALRCFESVRYVWGGEGLLGIDCSGLVRKGLIWGQLYHGLRTFNGTPIRDSIDLWWHDCSARALRDGHRGLTTGLFQHQSVEDADHSKLNKGDLAVTADGVHVMAYLGSNTWIEADPDTRKVIEVTLPTENHWFRTPVVFVRWKYFDPLDQHSTPSP